MPCTLLDVFTVIGQNKATGVLQRAYTDDRRHHAWVFSGPRGVGKFTTAFQFAKLILQIKHTANTHPDLHIIKKEDVVWSQNPSLQRKKQTNIPLDLLRERMIGGATSDDRNHEAIAYKTPVLADEKVFVIDEAELLDETAQNVLLKTLEEPPVGTTIILVTSREDLLLPTIVSRCQHVGFAPLDKEAMQRWVETSSVDIAPNELVWIIRFSGGSPGLVCEAVDAGLPALEKTLSVFLHTSTQMNYTGATSCIVEFINQYVDKKLKENPHSSKEALNRSGVQLILRMFGLVAQDMIRNKKTENGIAAATIISDVERQLSTNISVKVLLESLTARWVHLCGGDSLLRQH